MKTLINRDGNGAAILTTKAATTRPMMLALRLSLSDLILLKGIIP